MERYNAEGCTKEGLDYVIAGELKFPETGKSPSEEKESKGGWGSPALWSAVSFLSASALVYSLGELLADPDFPYRHAFIPINSGLIIGACCMGVFHAYYAISSQMKKSTQND